MPKKIGGRCLEVRYPPVVMDKLRFVSLLGVVVILAIVGEVHSGVVQGGHTLVVCQGGVRSRLCSTHTESITVIIPFTQRHK